MTRLLIRNCRLYDSLEKNFRYQILIEDEKIKSISNLEEEDKADLVIDAKGLIASPGLIDVHIQGAGGSDVLDCSIEALQTISKTLAKLGTTSFLATTVVKPKENNKHLRLITECVGKNLGGANIIGIHLEGPFINPNKKGGLDPQSIYSPSIDALEEIFKITKGNLKMMTIAPEIEGNIEIIKRLVDASVVASFGHSNATYQQTKVGFSAGISHVTHIFNAMPSLNHREPGPLLAIFEDEKVSAQIISDGVHLHPQIVNFVYRLLGAERCICITDGVQAIGLPEGKYFYNGVEYESKNGSARYLDGTLIGTAVGLNELVRRFKEFTNCSFETAINTVTRNPAKLLGIYNRKGSLEVGKDADIVLMNERFEIFCSLVEGKIVYFQNYPTE
ncbi:MAG: N-acetylglucosamine-6-phosphate deacetylase [Ignavibacteria bacterium]|nr:N-acetylglucosamine-6-phosphate deacetylase [Ignavibacteria bacterium]